MNNKTKALSVICIGTASLAILMAFSASHIGREPAPAPDIYPVSACTQGDRALTPPEPIPTHVGEETAEFDALFTPPTDIAFEPQKPSDSPAIEIAKEAPRDNPTPAPSVPQTTAQHAPTEPKMGDTRIMDGQQQVYFLGFGWIKNSDEPNIGIVVDGDGDINKMVGVM